MWIVLLAVGTAGLQVPVKGSVAEGYYWLEVWVGSQQVSRALLLDTGSSISGFPCVGCHHCGNHTHSFFDPQQSPTAHNVTCLPHTACGPSPLTDYHADVHCTECRNGVCRYYQDYKEGSAVAGQFVRDFVRLENGGEPVAMAFGCHDTESNLFRHQKADGMLGLSVTRSDVLSHTATIVDAMYLQGLISSPEFSLCFAGYGGVLTVGHSGLNLNTALPKQARMYGDTHYELRLLGLRVGSSPLLETPMPFASLLDSGTTFVYLSDPLHHQVRSYFRKLCSGKCGEVVEVAGEEQPCFVHSSGSKESFFKRFPILEVWLDDIQVQWEPSNYLFAWAETPKHYCLGIYPSGGIENVFGSIFMRGLNIAFSRKNSTLTFAPSHCNFRLLQFPH